MRLSSKLRAECVEYLLCCADDRVHDSRASSRSVSSAPPSRMKDVMLDAFEVACEALDYDAMLRDDYLEAAGLLLDGWNPGDPVVRL
jgi:hypothetical protein